MDDSDFQFLSEMAARCLERASRARDEKGRALPTGHFIPEELPDDTARALRDFFR